MSASGDARYRVRLRSGRSVNAGDVEPLPYGHLRAEVIRWTWVEATEDTMRRAPLRPRNVTYAAGEWISYTELEDGATDA